METILGLIFVLILLVGGCCLFFLIFVQPIWSIVDVAVSKEHSGGTKALVIVLTLLLLGPIMTFFYGCFGTRSRVLRNFTLICFTICLLSGGAMLVLAIAVPMVKQKLPWGSGRTAAAASAIAQRELVVPGVDPDTIPSFTAVQLVRNGTAHWTAAIAEFDGRGPKTQSALPVVLPGTYPLTHVAVDPKGPVYYGITTHEIGRIVPETGKFVELKSDPTMPKPSWPAAIAYDSKQELLLVAAHSHGHSYNPRTGEWQTLRCPQLNSSRDARHAHSQNARPRADAWVGHRAAHQQLSEDVLTVEEGSRCPALYRMEEKGWIESEGGNQRTNAGRSTTSSQRPGRKQPRSRRKVGTDDNRHCARFANNLRVSCELMADNPVSLEGVISQIPT